MKYSISSKLANAYLKEQGLHAVEQENLTAKSDISIVALERGAFYVKSLASLSVCNHLLLNNAQLKEMNYNKIKMLHSRISEVAAKIENFKALLKIVVSKIDSEKD